MTINPQTVRLGVLTNPSAQHNERFPFTHKRIEEKLSSTADAIVTACESEISEAVRCLLVDQKINVLGINGGDGTIHSTINALARLLESGVTYDSGEPVRKPTLLLLNGGTYNIASRAMRTNHNPEDTLTRFLTRWKNRPLDSISTREIGLLKVQPIGAEPDKALLGMVFGSQVIANTLELCDSIGGGYPGLAAFLAKGTLGYFLKSSFFKENRWRLEPNKRSIEIDGLSNRGTIGVVASTIDIKLVRGLVWALSATDPEDGFHSKAIHAKNPSDVVRLIPYLLWELQHPMIAARPRTHRILTDGNFTLDGELYQDIGPIEVTMSKWRFSVVSGEDI
jgi:hypothetical protein